MKNSKKPNINFYIIVILLLSAAMAAWSNYFKIRTQKDTVNIHDFPKQIGEWKSDEIPISDEEYSILETKNAFARRYVSPSGEDVMLFIIYSQTNPKVAHPPEICFSGSGSTAISKKEVTAVKNGNSVVKAQRMIFDQVNYNQLMYYWFKIGKTFTANYWHQQILIAFKSFSGKTPGSAMIRLTTVVKGTDVDSAEKSIKKFASSLVPLLDQYLP